MPELPEVETVMRGLKPVLEGHRIARVDLRRAGLRFPFPADFAARLAGRRIDGLTRRAKYILCAIEGGDNLLIHLGMTGRFSILGRSGARNLGEFYFETGTDGEGNGPHDHVALTLDDGIRVIYTDPRRFGVFDLFRDGEPHRLLSGIGVEPLGNAFHANYLAERFARKSAPLKAALLDQRVVAGLGNIYASEALYRARLSPRRKAGTLARRAKPDQRLDSLVRHIRDILNEAIMAGGSTLQDFAHTDGTAGAYQQRFAVYDREGEPCPSCGSAIKKIVQAGRSTFYCRHCQT
jgi:formamidopyrimidine-DNA glycosylase